MTGKGSNGARGVVASSDWENVPSGLMILSDGGEIEAISSQGFCETGERFAVSSSVFEYFDDASELALRTCMKYAAEQDHANVCWPVCTSTSREAVVLEAHVVSLPGIGSETRKFALRWCSPDGSAEGKRSPKDANASGVVTRDARHVAHDLNNLLTTIMSFAGFLMDDMDSTDPRRGDVDEVLQAASKAVSLTEQLMATEPEDVESEK